MEYDVEFDDYRTFFFFSRAPGKQTPFVLSVSTLSEELKVC